MTIFRTPRSYVNKIRRSAMLLWFGFALMRPGRCNLRGLIDPERLHPARRSDWATRALASASIAVQQVYHATPRSWKPLIEPPMNRALTLTRARRTLRQGYQPVTRRDRLPRRCHPRPVRATRGPGRWGETGRLVGQHSAQPGWVLGRNDQQRLHERQLRGFGQSASARTCC
jgi:hypothetical protein